MSRRNGHWLALAKAWSFRAQSFTAWCLAVIAGLVLGLASPPALAITPQDPAVQKACEKAVHFLLSSQQESRSTDAGGGQNTEIGVNCLVAVALLKSKVDPNHPLIKRAADDLRSSMRKGAISNGYYSVYHLGVGLVLFSALKDKDSAQLALKQLLVFQRDHGGFASFPAGWGGGDTSMTQYAVLGMWEASQLGVAVPPQAWQKVANWLMKNQATEGTFTYNPGSLTSGLTGAHSMTAAGLSSLYICANHLRKGGGPGSREDGKSKGKREGAGADDVPSALTPVSTPKKEPEKEKEKAGGPQVSVDMGRLQAAMARGDDWFVKNFRPSPELWTLYYLYAIERYYSFKEKLEGTSPEAPDWYDQGAAYLLRVQTADGTWQGEAGTHASAAFGLLFLIRGTKISLSSEKKADETAGGTLVSGSGLPADLTNIRLKGGKVVVKPLAGPAGELLEIMEKPDDPRFLAAVEGFGDLVVKADDAMLSPHLVRLRKLAKSDSPEARINAVTALGRSRNLDFAPTLIFALQDEDEQVVRAAWEGLRFVSRRFDSFGLSPHFGGDDDKAKSLAKAKAIEKWKAWYRSVRPDADFED